MKEINTTKEQFKRALLADGVLNKHRIKVLKKLYEFSFCIATSREIGKRLGQKTITINSKFGKIGHAVADVLNIVPAGRRSGTSMWWSVLADGVPDRNGFNCKLKDNLVAAISELGLFHEPQYYPDDVDIRKEEYPEGWLKRVMVNAYERNEQARSVCIEQLGLNCHVCNVNFEEKYGEIGKGFIHVHHKVKVSDYKGKKYQIDSIKDLVPVCPNSHAMMHRNDPPFTVEDLRDSIKNK